MRDDCRVRSFFSIKNVSKNSGRTDIFSRYVQYTFLESIYFQYQKKERSQQSLHSFLDTTALMIAWSVRHWRPSQVGIPGHYW